MLGSNTLRRWLLRGLLGAPLALTVLLWGGSSSGLTPSPGFTLGKEDSWFRVQNEGPVAATIGADYRDESGALVAQETNTSVKPGRSAPPFYQSSNATLPRGFRGSSTIFSDQNVGTLLLRSIKETETGQYRYSGLAASLPVPAKRVYLPLVMRNYGFHNAWNTRIIVMNTSASRTACVGISFWRAGGADSPPPRDPSNYNGCISIPPLGTIRRDVTDMTALGDQWLGSVMVDVVGAEVPPGSKQIIVANAETWNGERGTFAAYTGLCWRYPNTCPTSSGAAANVFLPLIYRSAGLQDQWQTFLMIQTHDNQDASVQIEFKGRVGSAPFETTYGPINIKTSRICYLHAPDPESQCAEGGTTNGPLPVGFVGSARVLEPTGSVPLAVVVTRASNSRDSYSSYSAFWDRIVLGSASQAPYSVDLPLVYKSYGWRGPNGNARGWNSWFQLQVADGGTANVTVTYYGDNGAVAATEAFVADGFKDVYQLANTTLSRGFIGSAIIHSDKPIAVVATVTSDAYTGDADASYEGLFP